MKNTLFTIIIAILASFGTYKFLPQGEGVAMADKKETVYERVMRTGKIRCGYFVEPPFTLKNESTGKFSGLSVELVTMIAKDLNLKVEWAEQISFATMPQDLNNNRYDMVCGSVFVLPRSGQMNYTTPYAYVSMLGYVAPDNTAFDKSFSEVDWNKVTIAGLDGEGATTAAQKILPEAKMNILPQLSSISEMLMLVASNKADIGFVLPSVFENFNKNNPNKLRKANLDKPLYSYAVGFGVALNQPAFKTMINNALLQLNTSGELDTLFDKHDPKKHFNRMAKPYKVK